MNVSINVAVVDIIVVVVVVDDDIIVWFFFDACVGVGFEWKYAGMEKVNLNIV